MSWFNTEGNCPQFFILSQAKYLRSPASLPFKVNDSEDYQRLISDTDALMAQNGFRKEILPPGESADTLALAEKQFLDGTEEESHSLRTLYLNEPCNLSVMLGGRDHVQICCTLPGLSLQDAAANAFKMDDLIDEREAYAFDASLGYLCSDPLECGTAMRAYALLFLPALTLHAQIEPLSVQLSGLGLSLRPMMSGSQAQNCLYMLSCRSSLRASEQEMLERMEDTTRRIIESERKLCEIAKEEKQAALTDRALRARAILGSAHLLGADEFLNLCADVRLGISLGILQDISPDLLNTLLVEVMPCTLTLSAEQPLRTAQDRDLFRAAHVKQRLGA